MSQAQYQHPLSRYPAVYGVSYRTVLRWAAKGYPLDDEPATRLLIGAQKNSHGISTRQARTNAPRTHAAAEVGALGLSASIQRLQEAEAAAGAAYARAAADDNTALAGFHRKEWLALSEQLRRVEQSTPEVEQANKKTLRLEELQAELGGLFTRLRQDLDTLPQRIALELVGKDEIGAREVLRREIEEIVSSLFQCKYLEGGANE